MDDHPLWLIDHDQILVLIQNIQRNPLRKNPGSRSLRCVWYCGRINEEIRKAVKLGEKSVKIAFPPKHYVVQHRELFQELYLNQGFDVCFEPNFKYIQPSEWYFTLGWEDDK